MKRVLSFFILAIVCCIMANAEWIECTRSDATIFYVNDNITQDENGYYYAWVKYETRPSELAAKRQDMYNTFGDTRYFDYTHMLAYECFDLKKSRTQTLSITHYASTSSIKTFNYDDNEWSYVVPDTMGEKIMDVVRRLVASKRYR